MIPGESVSAPAPQPTLDELRWIVNKVQVSTVREGEVWRWLASSLASLLADSERLNWLSAWTKGDQTICPPGEHGGAANHWLVAREDANDPRHSSFGLWADEWEAPTLREAIDAACSPVSGTTDT